MHFHVAERFYHSPSVVGRSRGGGRERTGKARKTCGNKRKGEARVRKPETNASSRRRLREYSATEAGSRATRLKLFANGFYIFPHFASIFFPQLAVVFALLSFLLPISSRRFLTRLRDRTWHQSVRCGVDYKKKTQSANSPDTLFKSHAWLGPKSRINCQKTDSRTARVSFVRKTFIWFSQVRAIGIPLKRVYIDISVPRLIEFFGGRSL